jgi:hypothetical protein
MFSDDFHRFRAALRRLLLGETVSASLCVNRLFATGGLRMDAASAERGNGRRIYVWAAWGSPLVGICTSITLWQWIVNHPGTRGERPPGTLLLYVVVLLVSAVGGLAGLVSLFGIRSRRSALLIIPGALLGTGINGCNAFYGLLAYLLEGKNLGG